MGCFVLKGKQSMVVVEQEYGKSAASLAGRGEALAPARHGVVVVVGVVDHWRQEEGKGKAKQEASEGGQLILSRVRHLWGGRRLPYSNSSDVPVQRVPWSLFISRANLPY
jgi:hypothetical protein